MKKQYRIVIAEDHTILREGLRALLSSNPDFKVVGEASDGRDAVRCVDSLQPDLVLMDLSMPGMNGLEAIHDIKSQNPEIKILVLTVHKAEEYIAETLRSGADGYVLKDVSHAELVMAIERVLVGKRYLSSDVSEKVIEGYLEGMESSRTKSVYDTLTQRERQI